MTFLFIHSNCLKLSRSGDNSKFLKNLPILTYLRKIRDLVVLLHRLEYFHSHQFLNQRHDSHYQHHFRLITRMLLAHWGQFAAWVDSQTVVWTAETSASLAFTTHSRSELKVFLSCIPSCWQVSFFAWKHTWLLLLCDWVLLLYWHCSIC